MFANLKKSRWYTQMRGVVTPRRRVLPGPEVMANNSRHDQDNGVTSTRSSAPHTVLNMGDHSPTPTENGGGNVPMELAEQGSSGELSPGESSGVASERDGKKKIEGATSSEGKISAEDESDNREGRLSTSLREGSGESRDVVSGGVLRGGVVSGGLVLAKRDRDEGEGAATGIDDEVQRNGNVLMGGDLVGVQSEGDNLNDATRRLKDASTQYDVRDFTQDDETKEQTVGGGGDALPGPVLQYSPQDQNGHIVSDDSSVPADSSQADIKHERSSGGPSRYLKHYYDWMYSVGTCAFTHFTKLGCENILFGHMFSIGKMVVVGSVFIFSEFHSFCTSKRWLLMLLEKGGYYNFAGFALSIVWLLAKIYVAWMLAMGKTKSREMLESMENYEKAYPSPKANGKSYQKPSWVTLLAVATTAFAFCREAYQIGTLNIEQTLLASSHQLSEDLFVWGYENANETSAQLKVEYGSELTFTTGTMGTIGIASEVSSYLQIGMVIDLVMLVALVIYSHVRGLMKDIKESTGSGDFKNVEEWRSLQGKRENAWRKYRLLKEIIRTSNDLFGPLFKLLHLVNMMAIAFFLFLIYFEYSVYHVLFVSINLVKAEIWYIAAGRIAESNDEICTWLRNWSIYSGTIRVGEVELNANMLIIELEKQPIGLGKGKFLMEESFHYKLLAFVGSVFFAIIDDNN